MISRRALVVGLRDYYGPGLIGRDPADIDRAHAEMDKAVAPGFTTGMPISRAGVDPALHDLVGRLQGKSRWRRRSEETVAHRKRGCSCA